MPLVLFWSVWSVTALMASALLATKLIGWAAARGAVDIPNARSSHSRATPRGGGIAIVVVTAFLLVFNAVSPLNWSRQQAPSWLQGTVQQISEVWVGQLAVFGVDMPRQGVREAWMAARDMRFPDQEPAEPAP